MEVTTDLKRTQYGLLSADWEMMPLWKFSSFITKGSTPTTYGYNWQSDGVRFLRSECVAEHGLDLEESMFISEEAHSMLDRSEVRSGDLLMTITGNVGRTILLDEDFGAGNINQHIARVRIKDARLDRRFAYHFLSQRRVRKYYESITTGQAYPQISLKQVRETEIPLPPLPEQRAIADALSDVDALIERLDALIAKKRAIKTATMQRLLTGKQRLPGFDGEWTTKRLGELLSFQVGFPFSSQYFNEDGNGKRLIKNRDLKSDDQMFYYTGPYSKSFVVRNGDLLVGMDGDFDPCLWNNGEALLNQRVGRIQTRDGLDQQYLYYAIQEPLEEIENSTFGTTVKHLSHGDIEDIELALPALEEQQAIATILSDMDAEIKALESRRDKTQDVKRGMMQELLTGRTRLV